MRSTDPAQRVADIEAVVAHARDTGATQVVVMGSSLGAQAALLVAAENDVAAVVGVSPATIPAGVERITVPAFFVAAEGDTGPADNARSLGRALGRPAEIVPGSVHGADLFADQPGAHAGARGVPRAGSAGERSRVADHPSATIAPGGSSRPRVVPAPLTLTAGRDDPR